MDGTSPLQPSSRHKQRANDILDWRRKRNQLFGRGMFGEPAWEMLLLLYSLDSPSRLTITRLAQRLHASKATAIRWIDYLEAQRLVQRESHPTDKRAIFVELTGKARELVEAYLKEIEPHLD